MPNLSIATWYCNTGSGNGFVPVWRQVTAWTNSDYGVLSIENLETRIIT